MEDSLPKPMEKTRPDSKRAKHLGYERNKKTYTQSVATELLEKKEKGNLKTVGEMKLGMVMDAFTQKEEAGESSLRRQKQETLHSDGRSRRISFTVKAESAETPSLRRQKQVNA